MFTRTGIKQALSCAAKRPLIVVDFDETITTKDTISLLAQFAYSRKLQSDIPPWSHFTSAYLKDYQHCKDQFTKSRNGTSIEDMIKQLSALKPVELASLERVSKAGVFAQLTKDQIQDGAQRLVPVRNHVLQVLQSNIDNVFVLSVSWSKDWILGALRPLSMQRSSVICNDLLFDNDVSTGTIIPSIVTADDKLATFQRLQVSEPWAFSLYIGDSETDLPCLVNADIGIIFGSNQSLMKTCGELGIDIVDAKQTIDPPSIQPNNVHQHKKCLYQAFDWADIDQMLEKAQSS